jgi:hypothetical protein
MANDQVCYHSGPNDCDFRTQHSVLNFPSKVANKEVSDDWVKQSWVCPHVFGGIPVAVVTKEYKMLRGGEGGKLNFKEAQRGCQF